MHHTEMQQTDLIKVSPDDVDVPGQRLQVVVALLGAEVSRAEDVLDLSWNQQLLELCGQRVAAVGNVQVT